MSTWALLFRQINLRPLIAGVVLFGIGCGSDSTERVPTEPPTIGTLKITVTTSGSYFPQGYQVSGWGSSYPLEPTDAVEIAVTPGAYTVNLTNRDILGRAFPPNCAINGESQRVVTITAGEVATVAYSVSCVTPTSFSTLIISTSTVGPGGDPDGYTVRIDNGDSLASDTPDAAGNLILTVPGLAPGVHSVFLSTASNCQVAYTPNPRYVTIDAYPEVSVSWQVYCSHSNPY